MDLQDSNEGVLHWINVAEIGTVQIYDDVKPFLERILADQDIFIGTSVFDGRGKLLKLSIRDLV